MTNKKVLVCVTKQKSCERLINQGYELIKDGGELFIFHGTKKSLSKCDNGTTQYLYNITKKYGANMFIKITQDIIFEIGDFIKKNNIDIVVLGESCVRKGSINDMVTAITKNVDAVVKFNIVPCEYNIWDENII